MRTPPGALPFVKGLDAFDGSRQPSLATLATCHFLEHGEHRLVRDAPGAGKPHLALGLGLKAIAHGDHRRGLFTTPRR
jgi:hypothetical protein